MFMLHYSLTIINTKPPLLIHPVKTSRVHNKLISLIQASSSASKQVLGIYSMKQEQNMRGTKLMEFPHLLSSHRDVMVDLIASVDKQLYDNHLLPSSVTVPPDVEFYESSLTNNDSQGTLSINRGLDSSRIDFILASWLHLKLPNGGVMNITNLQGYLKPTTDAPHFQFELVQCSPTYFILFVDLIPRKDLVLHQAYLKKFYEDNQRLEECRQQLASQVPEAKPYFASSLHFRGVVSPTGILVSIKLDGNACHQERAEEIIRDHVKPVANEVLQIWIDSFAGKEKGLVGEIEREELEKRDKIIKSRAIEIDLSSSMPLQFGQDVADRVLSVIKGAFGV